MTGEQISSRGLPKQFFVRAVGRTRDIEKDEITVGDLATLDESGRPTYLLSLDGREIGIFPDALQEYILSGEKGDTDKRALIKQRHPWYKMETRRVPPFLFAYLGRRNARFIRNKAGVVPLTGFLCVYPIATEEEFVEQVWRLLTHPDTIANLHRVAKSYGSGAIKVEPRALERVPITEEALRESDITRKSAQQFEMTFGGVALMKT